MLKTYQTHKKLYFFTTKEFNGDTIIGLKL